MTQSISTNLTVIRTRRGRAPPSPDQDARRERAVRGRHVVEQSVKSPGLSACAVQIEDLFAARDRVTVSFTLTYTQERTGKELTMTGTKCYRLQDGKIVELWGETDLYGFLRQAGLVPAQFPSL